MLILQARSQDQFDRLPIASCNPPRLGTVAPAYRPVVRREQHAVLCRVVGNIGSRRASLLCCFGAVTGSVREHHTDLVDASLPRGVYDGTIG